MKELLNKIDRLQQEINQHRQSSIYNYRNTCYVMVMIRVRLKSDEKRPGRLLFPEEKESGSSLILLYPIA